MREARTGMNVSGRRFLTVIIVVVIGFLGSFQEAAQSRSEIPLDGKTLYELHCARCHGAGGSGDGPQAKQLSIPPANFHSPSVKMKSDEQWLTTIEFGRVPTPMHTWHGRLTEEEMRAVVAYLRKLASQ